MEILIILAPLALFLGVISIIAFIWAVNKGQYEDIETPASRMLLDDEPINDFKKNNNTH